MQRFKAITAYLHMRQIATLLAVANESRRVTNPPQQVWSVSKLIRAAVQDFIQRLEEFEDERRWTQASHKVDEQPAPNLNTVARVLESNRVV